MIIGKSNVFFHSFRCLFKCLMILALMVLNIPGTVMADRETSDQYVTQGRNYLAQHNIPDAAESFRRAVEEYPSSEIANLFHAATRVLALAYCDEFNLLLDRNGAGSDGRDLYEWDVEFPEDEDGYTDLPDGAPTSTEYLHFLETVMTPEIDGALENLSVTSASVSVMLTPNETGMGEEVEVDYGDVLMYQAALHALRAAIRITGSYDIDFSVADLLPLIQADTFSINDDLLTPYINFLKLITPEQAASADGDVEQSIDSYLAASNFIRAETDDQEDDFISFDPESLADEAEFRNILQDIKNSLSGPALIGDEELENPFTLDMSIFFANPLDIRTYLPEFDQDNLIVACSWPDPTLNGIIPGYTQDDWNELLSISVPVTGAVTTAYSAHGDIHVESFEDYWNGWFESLADSTVITSPGDYAITAETGSTIWLRAWSDEDGNGMLSPGDLYGEAEANPVKVESENCVHPFPVDIELDLEISGIQGRIVNTDGIPIEGIMVSAGTLEQGAQWCNFTGIYAETDENGMFALNGIPEGTEVIIAVSAFEQGYSDGLWTGDGMTDKCLEAATYTSTGAGSPTIHITLERLSRITGTVTDEFGNPAAMAVINIYDAVGESVLGNGVTDAYGYYDFLFRNAPSGSIKVEAAGSYDSGLIPLFYDGKPGIDQADPLNAVPGAEIRNITFSLPYGGTISGHVEFSDNLPAAGIRISVYADFGDYWGWVSGSATDSNGDFEVKGLYTGNYVLEFTRYLSNGDQLVTYYRNKTNFYAADTVSVVIGEVTDRIDSTLPVLLCDLDGRNGFDDQDMRTFSTGLGTDCCAGPGDFDADGDIDGQDIFRMARSIAASSSR